MFVAVLLLALTTQSYAITPIEEGKMIVHLKQKAQYYLGVQLANLKEQRTKLNITDLNGEIWYSEYIWGEKGYAKNLNLEYVPNGTYVVNIQNRTDLYSQAFVKNDGELEFYDKQLITSNPSHFIGRIKVKNQNSLNIQLANLNKELVLVKLNTLAGSTLLEEKINGQHGYNKDFNLVGMADGTYYFFIKSSQVEQIQFFRIGNEKVVLGEKQVLALENETKVVATK